MDRELSGGRAELAVKAATGFAVAMFALVAAAAVAEAAITGSADPANWGQQVRHQVSVCKAALATGEHGIGQCVSAFASQHGQVISGSAKGDDQSSEDRGQGNGNGKGKGKANGHAHGQAGHKPDHTAALSDGAGD